MKNNIDDERIKKYLGNVEERINFAKENGCKLLECKTIDNNIKLRLENIKLKSELETYKKIAEKLAELLYRGDETDYICDLILGEHCVKYETGKCNQCIIDWARKEVENDTKNKK
jgi:hypothetical protein